MKTAFYTCGYQRSQALKEKKLHQSTVVGHLRNRQLVKQLQGEVSKGLMEFSGMILVT
jgi:hypothetical protein